jgi:hypothetical protein
VNWGSDRVMAVSSFFTATSSLPPASLRLSTAYDTPTHKLLPTHLHSLAVWCGQKASPWCTGLGLDTGSWCQAPSPAFQTFQSQGRWD